MDSSELLLSPFSDERIQAFESYREKVKSTRHILRNSGQNDFMKQKIIGSDGKEFNMKELLEYKKNNLAQMQEQFREILESQNLSPRLVTYMIE